MAHIGVSLWLIACSSPQKKMETQQNQSELTNQQSGPDSSGQQGGGGSKSTGKPTHPAQEPAASPEETPDTIREIPIGSPLPPSDLERLKREAEKPQPRPPKKEDDPDGQQDPQQDN